MRRRALVVSAAVLAALLAAGTALAGFNGTATSESSAWSSVTISAPTNLQATASCGSVALTAKVVLTWTASPTTQVTGYTIRRRTPPGTATSVDSVGAGVTTYTDSPLATDRTYAYVVRAQVSGFYTESAEVEVTTPPFCL